MDIDIHFSGLKLRIKSRTLADYYLDLGKTKSASSQLLSYIKF